MKHTPGPWRTEAKDIFVTDTGELLATTYPMMDQPEGTVELANARLIAAAPDHAIVARLLAAGKIRWERFSTGEGGELCFAGMRYSTELDEFGVPKLHDVLRAAIARLSAEDS